MIPFSKKKLADFLKRIQMRLRLVQEIMGTPPKWIIRWGIVIIFLVVLILLTGSFFYKYPDVIQARVTIVSINKSLQSRLLPGRMVNLIKFLFPISKKLKQTQFLELLRIRQTTKTLTN